MSAYHYSNLSIESIEIQTVNQLNRLLNGVNQANKIQNLGIQFISDGDVIDASFTSTVSEVVVNYRPAFLVHIIGWTTIPARPSSPLSLTGGFPSSSTHKTSIDIDTQTSLIPQSVINVIATTDISAIPVSFIMTDSSIELSTSGWTIDLSPTITYTANSLLQFDFSFHLFLM